MQSAVALGLPETLAAILVALGLRLTVTRMAKQPEATTVRPRARLSFDAACRPASAMRNKQTRGGGEVNRVCGHGTK